MKVSLISILRHPVSWQALAVLRIGFLIILVQLGYIIFDIFFQQHSNQLYALMLYQNSMEYIFLESVILIIGAFLFDITVRQTKGIS